MNHYRSTPDLSEEIPLTLPRLGEVANAISNILPLPADPSAIVTLAPPLSDNRLGLSNIPVFLTQQNSQSDIAQQQVILASAIPIASNTPLNNKSVSTNTPVISGPNPRISKQSVLIDKNISAQEISQLPSLIKFIMLGPDVTIAQVKAIPNTILGVSINSTSPVEVIKQLPSSIKSVILGSGVSTAQVKAIPHTILLARININSPLEAINQLPSSIKSIILDAGVSMAQVKAIPHTIVKVIIHSDSPLDAISQLPPFVKLIILETGVSKEQVKVIPLSVINIYTYRTLQVATNDFPASIKSIRFLD